MAPDYSWIRTANHIMRDGCEKHLPRRTIARMISTQCNVSRKLAARFVKVFWETFA